MVKVIDKCRICCSTNLEKVFSLKCQSLTGVFPDSATTEITSGDVTLVKCNEKGGCGLVQLLESYDSNEMYGDSYGYRTGLNPSMESHIQGKISKIVDFCSLNDDDVVIDIGSNDATALHCYPKNVRRIGVDPTGEKFINFYRDGIELIADFFSRDKLDHHSKGISAKVITSFSMFYDLEDPVAFALDIAKTLTEDGIWVFEQSYLPLMLETNSFDTICHEHLEFYALKQIEFILEKVDLQVIDVELNDINGGSFSITAAKKTGPYNQNINSVNELRELEKKLNLDSLDCFSDFRNRVKIEQDKFMKFISEARDSGKKVYALGASTKGNVLLQHYGLSSRDILSIGEVNPDKFGCFTPGTLIPIIPESDVLSLDPDYIVILPWHFKDFFLSNPNLSGKKLVFPLPEFQIVSL